MSETATKWCGRCKQFKDVTEFHNSHTAGDGKQSYCRECQNRYQALRRRGVERPVEVWQEVTP